MSYEYTNPGKGSRRHRNVSTRAYRAGWTEIFGRRKKVANEVKPDRIKKC